MSGRQAVAGILPRYLLRHAAGVWLLCMGASALMMTIVEIVGVSRHLFRPDTDAGPGAAFTLAWLKLPGVLYQSAPLAALLATLVSLALLRRRGELQALAAAGCAPARVALPYLLGGVLVAALTLGIGQSALPRASRALDRFMTETLRRANLAWTFYHRQPSWFRVGDWLINTGRRAEDGAYRGASFFEVGPGFAPTRRIDAGAMLPDGAGGFELLDARDRRFGPDGLFEDRYARRLAAPVALPPESLEVTGGWPEEMTLAELRTVIANRERRGLPSLRHRLALHRKLAFPLSAACGALLAAALALGAPRLGASGGVAGALARGGGLAFGWWLLGAICEAAAPWPWLAAWLPDLALFGGALALLRRAR